jgi:hypothetical protein
MADEITYLSKLRFSGGHGAIVLYRGTTLALGKLSPATKAGAPYLTAPFAGRCGKFANLDLYSLRVRRLLRVAGGTRLDFPHLPAKGAVRYGAPASVAEEIFPNASSHTPSLAPASSTFQDEMCSVVISMRVVPDRFSVAQKPAHGNLFSDKETSWIRPRRG